MAKTPTHGLSTSLLGFFRAWLAGFQGTYHKHSVGARPGFCHLLWQASEVISATSACKRVPRPGHRQDERNESPPSDGRSIEEFASML